MPEVVATDEFRDWYWALDESTQEDVAVSVDLLEEKGVALGAPYTSQIKGTEQAMRELRIQSKGDPVRVLYLFDPARQAVLLIGGNKKGVSDKEFYGRLVPQAEKVWDAYLDETGQKK